MMRCTSAFGRRANHRDIWNSAPPAAIAMWRLVWLRKRGDWLPTWLPRRLLARLMFDICPASLKVCMKVSLLVAMLWTVEGPAAVCWRGLGVCAGGVVVSLT
jgi:hypothetical protein